MARRDVSITCPCTIDEALDACDRAVRGVPWEKVGTWQRLGDSAHVLKLVNLPTDQTASADAGAASTMVITVSGVDGTVDLKLEGQRPGATGPLAEYVLAEQVGHLFSAITDQVADPPPGWQVFVSYRRADSGYIADEICQRLRERFGRAAVFKDTDAIPLGADFEQQIERVLGRCKVVVVIIGTEWLGPAPGASAPRLFEERDYVRAEIAMALDRGVPVIPVLVRGAPMPTPEDLPASIRDLQKRNALSVRRDRDFDSDCEVLIRRIAEIIDG